MTLFILRRLLALLPMLFAVTLLVFALMSLAPGDFLTPVKAQRDINPALIAELQNPLAWIVRGMNSTHFG